MAAEFGDECVHSVLLHTSISWHGPYDSQPPVPVGVGEHTHTAKG